MYYSQKRILAFLLTAAMVFTNLGTGLNVSYAGTADQVTFQMKGADLVAAVEEAIESGHEITADDLGFTNGRTAEFEKVFFGTKGAVYEVYPEMEGSSMEAELRVFVRLPEDAGDMYMAVSYTHLDVYKRQSDRSGDIGNVCGGEQPDGCSCLSSEKP